MNIPCSQQRLSLEGGFIGKFSIFKNRFAFGVSLYTLIKESKKVEVKRHEIHVLDLYEQDFKHRACFTYKINLDSGLFITEHDAILHSFGDWPGKTHFKIDLYQILKHYGYNFISINHIHAIINNEMISFTSSNASKPHQCSFKVHGKLHHFDKMFKKQYKKSKKPPSWIMDLTKVVALYSDMCL